MFEHIYWFAYYNLDSPSVRYRAKYPLEFASDRLGVSSNLIIPGYSPRRILMFASTYLRTLLIPKKKSLIVVQRVRSNFIYAKLLKLLVLVRKNCTVYDLDDADYIDHDPRTIYFFAKKCRYIAAGSFELAKYLRQFNENVFYSTSPIPDYEIVKKERNSLFTIGWLGGFSWGHKESLYTYLFPALKYLNFNFQLIIVGITSERDKNELINFFAENTLIKIKILTDVNWKDERELQNIIVQFDIGIATLSNNPFQIAKSGIKAKQYMNNGVPVICNDLPENINVVVDGYNGFICNSVLKFSEKITEFRNMDDEAYWRFSRHARKSIRKFDHRKYFEEFNKVISNNN